MRKSTVAILAVAIIGALGIYSKSGSSSAHFIASGPTGSASSAGASTGAAAGYKDGSFTGATEYTPYGPVQISLAISGGKITDINFLQMPSDLGHSREVTAYAEPLLKQITLQKQNANIDFVSGATSTSYGYQQSLQSALDKAAQGAASPSSQTGSNGAGSAPNTSPSPSGHNVGGEIFDN